MIWVFFLHFALTLLEGLWAGDRRVAGLGWTRAVMSMEFESTESVYLIAWVQKAF